MTSNSQTNLFDDSVVQDDMYYTGYFDEEDENDETIIIKQLGIRLVNVEDLRLGSNSASNFQLQGPGVVQKPFLPLILILLNTIYIVYTFLLVVDVFAF